jgi:simple sugar transport system permease protein
MDDALLNILNTIVASATPLVIASIGEMVAERAGMINLSLNGSVLLAALAGFAAAIASNSILVGVLAGMLVGALVALIIAIGAIYLRRDQVAVGFVLTLLAADLARFLGTPYNSAQGPTVNRVALPLLSDIPVLGPILFNHTLFVYFSFALVILTWVWLFKTRPGLAHRATGENPHAAFARGTPVNALRYAYMVIGGALIGLAGTAYSLDVKAGWAANPAMDGDGWIALAIVIFAGWHPFRVVLGAYLFAGLRAAASAIQRNPDINIPLVLLNGLPWVLMILTLMLVSTGGLDRLMRLFPTSLQNRLRQVLRSNPPAALGTPFEA